MNVFELRNRLTYRGRQGADVALLVRRVREAFGAERLQCDGTSATLAGSGPWEEQRVEVARVSSTLFGDPVCPEDMIGETLVRVTRRPRQCPLGILARDVIGIERREVMPAIAGGPVLLAIRHLGDSCRSAFDRTAPGYCLDLEVGLPKGTRSFRSSWRSRRGAG